MQPPIPASIPFEVARLMRAHYVFPQVAEQVALKILSSGYPDSLPELAAAITADLQSVNGDKHLRLIHHAEPLPEQAEGDDSADLAAFSAWADRTCGGVSKVECLPLGSTGNAGLLEIHPVLFPTAFCADRISAAMTLLADSTALIIDLRRCLGGEPTMVAWLASYLFDHEPRQLSGLDERKTGQVKQLWTLPWVPGRRFGPTKPVFVLTGPTTFSGGEALAYDLQALGRAQVVGERTRGGAHPREAFRVHPHLELTVSVARSVSPITGTNWEGVGVVPDVAAPADDALAVALGLAA